LKFSEERRSAQFEHFLHACRDIGQHFTAAAADF
jgi:hypothetical protein